METIETIVTVPINTVRDTNIDVKNGKIIGNVYSLVQNQGIKFNTQDHNLNPIPYEKATSLEKVRKDTILGIVDFKQQCSGCNVLITGGTERGRHDASPNGHEFGYKLDLRLNDKVNDFIQNTFPSTGNRIYDNASGYKDNSGNGYWREGNHWDVKFNQNYKYNGYTIK